MNRTELSVEEWLMTDTIRKIAVEIIRNNPKLWELYQRIIGANPGIHLVILVGEGVHATDDITEKEKKIDKLKSLMVMVRVRLYHHATYRSVVMPFRERMLRDRPYYYMMLSMVISPSLTNDPFTMSHEDRALMEELILSIGLPPEGL